jgi:twitching motility protein PilU
VALQNELTPMSRIAPKKEEPDQASFTEITLDVRPDDGKTPAAPWMVKK